MLDSREAVIRAFWALLIGSDVGKDGQVSGFDSYWRKMTPWRRHEAIRASEWAWVKIERDHRDAEECIAAAVKWYRRQIEEEPPDEYPSRPEYAGYRFALIERILNRNMTPADVAQVLEESRHMYPEITAAEIDRYREMGDSWEPWDRKEAARFKAEREKLKT